MTDALSIVFAGTPEFALPCLDALAHSAHHLKAIYTQPDRPAGRGRKLQHSAVKKWALAHELSIYQPLNFKSSETVAELAALNPDVMVVIAYGLILPKVVLEIPKMGCINVHASLLPRWRGASPIQHAILHGDGKTGITVMQMDVGMDTGKMLSTAEYSVTPTDTAGSLHDILAHLSVEPLLATLDALARHETQATPQNNELATYAGKINKEDALINWSNSAIEIDRMIRAYNPWPIAYTLLNNEVLRIHQAHVLATESREAPGTLLNIDKQGILVATGNKALLIEKIQLPGARAIWVADWLNAVGTQLHTGIILQ